MRSVGRGGFLSPPARAVTPPPLTMSDREVVVRLADGPCEGVFATVKALGEDCYQRLDRGEQVWLRYRKNLFVPGEYVWSGEALTTEELGMRMRLDHHTYGQSEGA